MNKQNKSQYLVGLKFGKLTVKKFAYHSRYGAMWWVECDCGSVKCCLQYNLLSWKSKSCGKGKCSSNYKRGYAGNSSSRTTEYVIWDNMKRRCGDNPKASGWKFYGKLGVRVCERWQDFDNFLADMGKRPSKDHSIDRIDGDGDYSPENCRWATQKEQARNKKDNVWLEDNNGRRMILIDWAKELGCSYQCIKNRLAHGWSVHDAVTTPSKAKNPSRAYYVASA